MEFIMPKDKTLEFTCTEKMYDDLLEYVTGVPVAKPTGTTLEKPTGSTLGSPLGETMTCSAGTEFRPEETSGKFTHVIDSSVASGIYDTPGSAKVKVVPTTTSVLTSTASLEPGKLYVVKDDTDTLVTGDSISVTGASGGKSICVGSRSRATGGHTIGTTIGGVSIDDSTIDLGDVKTIKAGGTTYRYDDKTGTWTTETPMSWTTSSGTWVDVSRKSYDELQELFDVWKSWKFNKDIPLVAGELKRFPGRVAEQVGRVVEAMIKAEIDPKDEEDAIKKMELIERIGGAIERIFGDAAGDAAAEDKKK